MSRWITILITLLSLQCLGQDSRETTLLGHWDIDGLPVNGSNARYNEVWGFTANGEEFAVIGSTLGSHIIHVKGNNNLEEVAFIPGTGQGDFVVHRDYDTYGNYLYAVSDQDPAALQIVDFSGLPESVEVVYESSALVGNAHNFFIDQTTGRGYACGSDGIAVKVLDLSTNPEAPISLLNFTDVPYVHDCYVRNDTAFLNTGNPGLFVVSFEDIAAPQFLGTLEDYPDSGYNHSGWLDPSGKWYCFADETMDASMKLCNVEDLSDIQITDFFDSGNTDGFIAHNLYFKDSLIFVSHYFDGLQVFDWSDPEEVRRIAWYDSSIGEDICCRGVWGVYPFLPSDRILMSDRQRGLFVVKLGFERIEEPSIFLSPNPASETLEVNLMDFGFNWNVGEYRMFTPNGQLIDEGTIENPGDLAHWFELDVQALASGVYIVEFTQGDKAAQSRFVKN